MIHAGSLEQRLRDSLPIIRRTFLGSVIGAGIVGPLGAAAGGIVGGQFGYYRYKKEQRQKGDD